MAKKAIHMKESVKLGSTHLLKGKSYERDEKEADGLIARGYAVEHGEMLKAAVDERKMRPENRPVDESDKVIAEHESGAEVLYKDPRVKGPLEAERVKEGKESQVQELPKGDIPTGTPVGVLKAAQGPEAKANVAPAGALEVDKKALTETPKKSDDEDSKKKKK